MFLFLLVLVLFRHHSQVHAIRNTRALTILWLQGTSQDNADLLIDDNLAFSKDRTISRLTEMESMEYMLEHAKRRAPHLLLALEERGGAEKAFM